MINISKEMSDVLTRTVYHECVNRVDIGIFTFQFDDEFGPNDLEGFTYSDNIAVAALLKDGVKLRDAAVYVNEGLVSAVSVTMNGIENAHHNLRVGYFRLADGSVWSVSADMDYKHIVADDVAGEFLVVATRGTSIVGEDPVDRACHLLTECDERGTTRL